MQRISHHLHRASAAAGGRLFELCQAIIWSTAGLTSEHHLAESRDTDHVLSLPKAARPATLAPLPEKQWHTLQGAVMCSNLASQNDMWLRKAFVIQQF
jgi:hypothetical protein